MKNKQYNLSFSKNILASLLLCLLSVSIGLHAQQIEKTAAEIAPQTTNQSVVTTEVVADFPVSVEQSVPQNTSSQAVTPFYQHAKTNAPVGGGTHLVTVTLGLMAIIGLIFALSWLVKRFTQGAMSGNSHIKILSALPLGTRERVVLIEAGGEQLLVGVTATQINTLHVLKNPIVMTEKSDITSEFSKKLMTILQQKNSPESGDATNNHNAAG